MKNVIYGNLFVFFLATSHSAFAMDPEDKYIELSETSKLVEMNLEKQLIIIYLKAFSREAINNGSFEKEDVKGQLILTLAKKLYVERLSNELYSVHSLFVDIVNYKIATIQEPNKSFERVFKLLSAEEKNENADVSNMLKKITFSLSDEALINEMANEFIELITKFIAENSLCEKWLTPKTKSKTCTLL